MVKQLFVLLVLGLGASSFAASPCDGPEYKQFDFWLGEWEVKGGPKLDTPVGKNTIAKVSSGCALSEHWVNSKGQDGHSLNTYEPSTRQWTQFWVGSDGVVLRLQGGVKDGVMRMEGTLPGPKGGVQQQRISWTPKPDGSVIQRWETSDDDSKTWQVSFVGVYRRTKELKPVIPKH